MGRTWQRSPELCGKAQAGGPRALLRSTEAGSRGGKFTGLVPHPPSPPPPHTLALSTEPHTRHSLRKHWFSSCMAVSSVGQVYLWGILFACPKETLRPVDTAKTCVCHRGNPHPQLTRALGRPQEGSPMPRSLTRLHSALGCSGAGRTAPLPFPGVPTPPSWTAGLGIAQDN